MRLSNNPFPTLKQDPADETAKNAKLLIRAGYIHKEMAGSYVLLPLGLRVVENIKSIVRKQMNATGAHEMLMTTLQRQELWQKTDRWDSKKVDIWFKTQLQSGKEIGLAWSHEEPITDMVRGFINSYRDLPVRVYQFQNKLRNEVRAKSGILRGREFIMKDLYSYSKDEAQHQTYYDQVIEAYHRVFAELGIGDKTYLTYASGGDFTEFSHEFQTITNAGEDTIYLDRQKKLAVNEEVLNDKVLDKLGLKRSELAKVQASEVGNIFSFGTTKSEQLDLTFTDEDGRQKFVVLGSYGIGITRLIGVIVELMADDKGLVWPINIAPYKVYLAIIGTSEEVIENASKIYQQLKDQGIKVIYDDRDLRAGEKFTDADYLGIPWRLVVSAKTVAQNAVEIKQRTAEDAQIMSLSEALKVISSNGNS